VGTLTSDPLRTPRPNGMGQFAGRLLVTEKPGMKGLHFVIARGRKNANR
jgi:hypothetical protein